MIPLIILSLITIYIFGMKWWTISRASKIDPNFMRDIRDHIQNGKIAAAQNLCRQTDTPVSHLIEKGIERMGNGCTVVRLMKG